MQLNDDEKNIIKEKGFNFKKAEKEKEEVKLENTKRSLF